jgi:hypothetical protein
MKLLVWLLPLGLLTAPALSAHGAHEKEGDLNPAGLRITVSGPTSRQYEVALDEIELDWSRRAEVKRHAPGRQAVSVPGANFMEREAARAVAKLDPVAGIHDLHHASDVLRAANPGAEAHFVLYEPGRPRSKATRHLLTSEVGLVLEPNADLQVITAGLSVVAIRPVAGVASGYVVDAADPMAALDLVEALVQRPGVKTAYPLLRRQYFKQ